MNINTVDCVEIDISFGHSELHLNHWIATETADNGERTLNLSWNERELKNTNVLESALFIILEVMEKQRMMNE